MASHRYSFADAAKSQAAVEWFAGAGLAALCGLVIGGIAIVAMHSIISPLMKTLRAARS